MSNDDGRQLLKLCRVYVTYSFYKAISSTDTIDFRPHDGKDIARHLLLTIVFTLILFADGPF